MIKFAIMLYSLANDFVNCVINFPYLLFKIQSDIFYQCRDFLIDPVSSSLCMFRASEHLQSSISFVEQTV